MRKYFFLLLLAACLFTACKNDNDANNGAITSGGIGSSVLPPEVVALGQQVNLYPDSAGKRLQFAIALDSISQYGLALAQMDTLVKRDSSNYGLWYTRAQVEEHANDTPAAISSYSHALSIYPSADAMLNLANIYAEQKNPRSLQICDRVKQLGMGRSYDAACAFIAGVYHARNGEQQPALALFDESIKNDYTYMEAYIEKGLIYFDRKQYRQALNIFSLAAQVNRLYADAYYWMGRCYEMMRTKDSAVYYFKQSLALDKDAPETHKALQRLGAE